MRQRSVQMSCLGRNIIINIIIDAYTPYTICTKYAHTIHTIHTIHNIHTVYLRNSVIESLFGQVAGLIGRVEDLVVENRVVQSQAQSDRGWERWERVGMEEGGEGGRGDR